MIKVALCEKRDFPPRKREDGFHPLPPEVCYNLIEEVSVNDDAEIIRHKSNYYIKTDMKFGDLRLYQLSTIEISEPCADQLEHAIRSLQFYARRYADGRRSAVCSTVNCLTEELIKLGYELIPETSGDRMGSIWAFDGDPLCCEAEKFENKYGPDGKKKEDINAKN